LERENECTSFAAVSEKIEESLRCPVLTDDQDRLVAIDVVETVRAHGEVARAAREWLPCPSLGDPRQDDAAVP
jgi:hypothetical protein